MPSDARPPAPGHNDLLVAELRELLGERLSTSAAVCERHGRDESYHPGKAPDAVAFANSTEEVAAIVTACARYGRPVIPFGVGTSLEGQVAALKGGVCIDLSQMNQVLQVNNEDLDCRVQAGVTRKQLDVYLRDTGLFFPIDPGADATLGGMAATRASGTNAVRYGTMRDNVLGLTVVLADGRVIRTGGRARKSAAGYDLNGLFIGSEGTLGVITEIQLRLYGVPEAISSAVCSFDSLEGAVDTVILTIQSGIPVARIELLDEVSDGRDRALFQAGLPGAADLVLRVPRFRGFRSWSRPSRWARSRPNWAAGTSAGPGDRRSATSSGRRATTPTTRPWRMRPGAKGWATDVCVPISRLAECIMETKRDLEDTELLAPIVGHVGDGNFHLVYLIDPEDEAELARAAAHNERMVLRALAMGGTCTGEHGIGYGKLEFLRAEHGEAVSVMGQVKQALDPHNIMNPGKVVSL